jgi:hypothetical protein
MTPGKIFDAYREELLEVMERLTEEDFECLSAFYDGLGSSQIGPRQWQQSQRDIYQQFLDATIRREELCREVRLLCRKILRTGDEMVCCVPSVRADR